MKKLIPILIAFAGSCPVIARIFDTFEEGEKFCDELFQPSTVYEKTNGLGPGDEYTIKVAGRAVKYFGYDPETTKVFDTLFIRYYGGCGEAEEFALVEVEPNTAFAAYDLD